MDSQAILEELVLLLEGQGVCVRHEAMGGGGGGLCKLKDKEVFFVDTEARMAEMISLCAAAVRERVDIETVYLRPVIRDIIEASGNGGPSGV